MGFIVDKSKEEAEEEKWPEEEIVAEAARRQDAVERVEEVAKSKRKHWALEILLEELWRKEKERRDVKRWSKEILLNTLWKIVRVRSLLFNTIGIVIETVEEEWKNVRRLEADNRRRMFLEDIRNRREVVDRNRGCR